MLTPNYYSRHFFCLLPFFFLLLKFYMNPFTTMRTYFYLFTLCLFLLSCGQKNNTVIDEISLEPIDQIDQINDSIFITDGVEDIHITSSQFLIADSKQGKLFFLNRDMKFEFWKQYGEGPEKVRYTYSLASREDKVVVSDYGKSKFHALNDSGLVAHSYNSPFDEFHAFLYNFGLDSDDNIISENLTGNAPIIQFDTSGTILNSFGRLVPSENEGHKRSLNNRHLHVNSNDQVINVYISKPQIELWSQGGELISTIDLSQNLEFRSKRYKQIIKANPGLRDRFAFTFYNDSYIDDNMLYLLYIGDYEDPNSNQIFVINTSDNKLKLTGSYYLNLPGAYFKEIAIKQSMLYAYDKAGAEIIKFDLK